MVYRFNQLLRKLTVIIRWTIFKVVTKWIDSKIWIFNKFKILKIFHRIEFLKIKVHFFNSMDKKNSYSHINQLAFNHLMKKQASKIYSSMEKLWKSIILSIMLSLYFVHLTFLLTGKDRLIMKNLLLIRLTLHFSGFICFKWYLGS